MVQTGHDTPDAAELEIVLTRVYPASRERVFAAWTDPQQLARWWGPSGFTNTIHEMDVRPGGVLRPERLVYAHSGDDEDEASAFHTTVTFAEQDGQTLLTMRALFPSAAARAQAINDFGAIEGGKQTLESLARYLAAE